MDYRSGSDLGQQGPVFQQLAHLPEDTLAGPLAVLRARRHRRYPDQLRLAALRGAVPGPRTLISCPEALPQAARAPRPSRRTRRKCWRR